MKKRFICLLLTAVMLLVCLAGCGDDSREEVMAEIGKEASKDAVTLSMYLMSEQPVSDSQKKLMEEKVNEITKEKFNIAIELTYATPDVYYATLEDNLAKMKEFYDGGAQGKVTQNPVYIDENGLPAVYYPAIEEFDVDIFYFGGYDKYYAYKSAGYLRNLDEELKGSAKSLKAVINNTFMSAFNEANGGYYAVPTNRAIGEYTYILLNKDVLDSTQYAPKDITSLTCDNCQDLLNIVNTEMSDDFVPLYSATGELDVLGVKYFNTDANGLFTDEFSIIGGTYNPAWKQGALNSFPEMAGILGSANVGHYGFADQMKILKNYEFEGYYATEAEADKPFAVGYVKGLPQDIEKYTEDYEVVIAEYPTIKFNDLYESMFGITQYTNSVVGSTEVLTLLNTDKDFRNLILYGVEGENYTWVDSEILDENGDPYRVVSKQTKDPEKVYDMAAIKTGNVALAYDQVGDNPIVNANIFNHNADLRKDFIFGYSFYDAVKSEAISAESFAALTAINASSKDFYDKIKAAKTEEELNAVIAEINAVLGSQAMAKVNNKDNASKSPAAHYYSWLVSKKLWERPM